MQPDDDASKREGRKSLVSVSVLEYCTEGFRSWVAIDTVPIWENFTKMHSFLRLDFSV